MDELFGEHLDGVGHRLYQTPGAYAVRTEAALKPGADFALVQDVEEGQQGVEQQQTHAYKQALDGDGEPGGHAAGIGEEIMHPHRYRRGIVGGYGS